MNSTTPSFALHIPKFGPNRPPVVQSRPVLTSFFSAFSEANQSLVAIRKQISEKLKALVSEGRAAIEREAVTARLPWVEVEVPTGLHVNLDGEPIKDTKLRFEAFKHWLRFHLPDDSPVLSDS